MLAAGVAAAVAGGTAVAVFAAGDSGPVVPPEALVGFGAATPIVAVLLWLLMRSEARADRLETMLLEAYKTLPGVTHEASDAMRATTEAVTAMTIEIRSAGRSSR